MAESQWVQFSMPGTGKRKRAGLACISCHSKKIRCDLQTRSNHGQNSCSHCASAGKDCRPRPSKRDKGRSAAEIEVPHTPLPPIAKSPRDYRTRLASLHLTVAENGASIVTDSADRRASQNLAPHDQAQPSLLDFDPGLLSQPEWATFHASTRAPATSGSQETRLSNGPSSLDAWSANWVPSFPEQSHRAQVALQFRPTRENTGNNANTRDAIDPAAQSKDKDPSSLGVLQPDLRQSFTETYFEYCYTWCPVINRTTVSRELAESPLLDNAIAIVGSHVRPPLIPQAGPAVYYDRARRLFYDEDEENLITTLKAVSLFYWWAPRPPSVVHKHSSWWWTSVVIRHAQQAGFYRESAAEMARHDDIELCIRRRIWWTAFARERLTAICQGKPCLIDPADCNIPSPSLRDFPDFEDKSKAEVFIYWVRLCTIIGRIAKRLSLSANSSSTTNTFTGDLDKELIDWVRSLPPHLQLPIGSSHTPSFNRDVHQLHLPYLAVIVVLHLTRSPQSLPQALPPATLAGSCIARILKDVLVRSETRFLMPITCWYTGMGFIALLQASRSERLKDGASADLEILILAIKELKNMWATAALFEQTFERLRSNGKSLSPEEFPNRHLVNEQSTRALNSEEAVLHSGVDWIDYFPFVTSETSVVAENLLDQQNMDFTFWDGLGEMAFDTIPNYQDFMEGIDSWADPNAFL
ncbi:hypothetical protein N7474_003000 [Penicillium riverlandense]|uniref:uncharacterized protein n=1 Tax=Penicillium riverlandense TaxID=1903569 RepID=UPI00254659ED|nr:uncharacterized protein N7474_003000 [Penicillium riverlandense]KAJ5825862.1 hypothetical protein N7474_003000 [Penicillium riverlandense]